MGALGRLPRRLLGPSPPALAQVLHSPQVAPEWSAEAIDRETLDELHALMALGPSLVDASPVRVLFLTSRSAKDRLSPFLTAGAGEDVRQAPAFAVIGYDREFAEHLVEFLPAGPGASACFDRPEVVRATAMRNGALQGAYLTIAARALGLEAAVIEAFDAEGLALEFFRSRRIQATFLCSLGYPADPD